MAEDERYPAFVGDHPEKRRRWDMAIGVASRMMEEPPGSAVTRETARWLYFSDIATGDPPKK